MKIVMMGMMILEMVAIYVNLVIPFALIKYANNVNLINVFNVLMAIILILIINV
jgi:hypothetical protein